MNSKNRTVFTPDALSGTAEECAVPECVQRTLENLIRTSESIFSVDGGCKAEWTEVGSEHVFFLCLIFNCYSLVPF